MISKNLSFSPSAYSETSDVDSFDAVLLEVINNVLENIFGQKFKNWILQIMENRYTLTQEEIPLKAHVFSDALNAILGKSSIIIEDLILDIVHEKFNVEFKWKNNSNFSHYVNELKILSIKEAREGEVN